MRTVVDNTATTVSERTSPMASFRSHPARELRRPGSAAIRARNMAISIPGTSQRGPRDSWWGSRMRRAIVRAMNADIASAIGQRGSTCGPVLARSAIGLRSSPGGSVADVGLDPLALRLMSSALLLERLAGLRDVLGQLVDHLAAQRLLDQRAHHLYVVGVRRERVGGHHPATFGRQLPGDVELVVVLLFGQPEGHEG